MLTKGVQAKVINAKGMKPLPHAARYCVTWRGGGFRDECKAFFEEMMAKADLFYRVPGYLASSLERGTAMKFIRRAATAHPRVLWCILVCSTASQHLLHNHMTFTPALSAALFTSPSPTPYRRQTTCRITSIIICRCLHSSTRKGRERANFGASTPTSFTRPKFPARWSSFTRRTLCSRQVFRRAMTRYPL